MNEIQSINQQMALIANLARAYANATPEQRANVSLSDMQNQLNRYNELKARRNELYAEQEARVQKELEEQRRANQQQINTRGTWRTIVNRWNNNQTFVPVQNQWWLSNPGAVAFDANWMHVMNSDWTITTTPNQTAQTNLNTYDQRLLDEAQARWQQQNSLVNPNIARTNNMNNTWTITPISETQYRNSLPRYQQWVTPYSEWYINEVTQNQPSIGNWYSNYRARVGNDYWLRNNW